MLEGWDSGHTSGSTRLDLDIKGLLAVLGGVTSTLLGPWSHFINHKRGTNIYKKRMWKIDIIELCRTCLTQVLWRSFRENWTIWLTSAPSCCVWGRTTSLVGFSRQLNPLLWNLHRENQSDTSSRLRFLYREETKTLYMISLQLAVILSNGRYPDVVTVVKRSQRTKAACVLDAEIAACLSGTCYHRWGWWGAGWWHQ